MTYKMVKHLPSNRKDGYQVFFSDIFNNTLSAEVKSFCLPYDHDLNSWKGSSTFFFFVFDHQGKIKEVYSGETVHYE
ncbi:hypothetical protein [Flammeovirga sp. SJP92]|uniref:hypothetical protein n=1 Tax=Flammeovirga sp. SJP92 TaxID=1775430 RepID=UPI00078785E4|nr:hypothetical protein [Flammeovirga sp. SJP92]KXX67453.1 hypothetical protein AVL50_29545 [Flammeovirga sp. SJP92]